MTGKRKFFLALTTLILSFILAMTMTFSNIALEAMFWAGFFGVQVAFMGANFGEHWVKKE